MLVARQLSLLCDCREVHMNIVVSRSEGQVLRAR